MRPSVRATPTVRRRPPTLIVALLVLLVVALGGTALQLALRPSASPGPSSNRTGGPAPFPPPPAQPLIVSAAYVRDNGGGGAVIAGQPVTVSAHALGEAGVAALELWDGDRLAAVEEADPASVSPAFYARWQWEPEDLGPHTLFVRAVDVRGGVVQSNAVRVQVAQARVPDTGRAVGRAMALAGSGFAVGRAMALAGNGFPVDLAAAPTAPKYGIGVPTLQTNLEGCQLNLEVSDAPPEALGIQLVGLAPAAASFTPLMTLTPDAAKQTQTVNLAGGGIFLFSASAFDDSVLAYSPPVEVAAPENCATGGWSGDVSLVDGKLNAPQQVDQAYLYLTQGDGAAVRIPAEQSQFVDAAQDGVLDFGPLLPPLDGSALEIEAWGWKQGALVKLGNGSFTPTPSPTPTGGGPAGGGAPIAFGGSASASGMLTTLKVVNRVLSNSSSAPPGVDCIGPPEFCSYEEPANATTIERPAIGSTTPIIEKFQWTTLLPNVSQFAWQILPYPPANTADLASPFLIDQGVIAVAPGQSEGEFSLDFRKYFLATVAVLDLEFNTSSGGNAALAPLFPGKGSATPSPTPTPGSGTQSQFAFSGADPLKLLGFGNRFYVRIVPIQFNSAMLPSGAVTLDVVEPAEPIQVPPLYETWNPDAYTIQWSATLPVGPNPDYARCALVKAVGSDVPSPWSETYKQAMSSGEPLCYEPPSDDGWSPFDVFEAFVEFVADVWDYVSDGIDWIKEKVVSAVLVAVPCKQIASEAVCKGIANTALDAALITMGVPPTLPDFDTVVAGLKGDLATFIVESAGSIPGVAEACGLAEAGNVVSSKVKTCEELAGVAIDQIVAQVKQARSDAAAQAAGIPTWPGLVLEPDPRGIWHAPSFNLTITRTSDPKLPKACSLSVWMKSTKKGWTYPYLKFPGGYPKEATADVSGQPLGGTSMLIPPLAPGESMTRQLWLTTPTVWFESPQARDYWMYYQSMLNVKGFTRSWALLTQGAELTFGIESNCAKSSEQGPYVLPKSAYEP